MSSYDLVVVLPGIMGSTLRDAGGHLVWAPSAGATLRAIRTFGGSITKLQLPEGIGDEHPGDGVQPASLMPDLHVLPGLWTPVKGYDQLLKKLRSLGYRDVVDRPDAPPGNLMPVPYDWRLSNRWNGRRLGTVVEPALERWRAQGGAYEKGELIFVCHSMGGLVARWYIEHCGGAQHTRKLITLGTPYRGAAKALEQLVNGAHPGLGRFAVNLTDFGRSLPSLHQLVPEYACIEHRDDLAKTTEVDLPDLASRQLADAMRFYTQLQEAEAKRPRSLEVTHAIVGIQQPTTTTVRLDGGRARAISGYRGEDLFGDATVPIVGGCRADVPMDSNTLRRVPDKHGNLHRNKAALDEIEGILTARDIVVRAPDTVELQVDAPELVFAGEEVRVLVTPADGSRQALRVTVTSEVGDLLDARVTRVTRGTNAVTFDDLPPGAYTIDAGGVAPGSRIAPVSSSLLVWDAPEGAAGEISIVG